MAIVKIRKKQTTFRLEPTIITTFKQLSNELKVNQTGVIENMLIDWILKNSNGNEHLESLKKRDEDLKNSFKASKI